MDLEIAGSQNWLEVWRIRKGLCPRAVDKILSMPDGWTEAYEELGLMKVPCNDLVRLAQVYRVPAMEFHKIIWIESARRRSQLT